MDKEVRWVCEGCSGVVYAFDDKVVIGEQRYHQSCFKCAYPRCGVKLFATTYRVHEGKKYCQKHIQVMENEARQKQLYPHNNYKTLFVTKENQQLLLEDRFAERAKHRAREETILLKEHWRNCVFFKNFLPLSVQ